MMRKSCNHFTEKSDLHNTLKLFQSQEEEDEFTNRDDDDEEPSKRSELSDKVKVTAVVEHEPTMSATSGDEPQPLQVRLS